MSGPKPRDFGDPAVVDRYLSERMDPVGDCWVWRLKGPGEYGAIKIQGTTVLAHRFSYAYHRVEIPEGLFLDHLCRNKRCINPWHLEPVTNAVNLGRWAETNTHCIQGHEWTEENTYWRTGRPGRECRACGRETKRRAYRAVA